VTEFRIEKLARHHAVDAFDCGHAALNEFLIRFAFPNQQANASQSYVGLADDAVIGFYTLAVGEVSYADAADRLAKGLARHPIPTMLLARMGVDQAWQGKGVGAGLLKDAMRRTMQAADIAGIRAFIVHAKDERARSFYEYFGFAPSPTDPLHLYLLVKDLRHAAGYPGQS
jgi:GNAT superfamily N-acetyltransferase